MNIDINNRQYVINHLIRNDQNEAVPSVSPPSYDEAVYSQPAPITSTSMTRESRLQTIIRKYEITEMFARKLLEKLDSFNIVFIFDDSGSMLTRLDESPLNHGHYQATRWDELKYFAQISIEIGNIFNAHGTDVYFLNRPMANGVKCWEDLFPYLVNEPSGYTPLTPIFNAILENNRELATIKMVKPLLMIVVTDGEPTDHSGRIDIDGFWRALKSRPNDVFTTIVCCTDERETMAYLNEWDRRLPRLDVVDDFKSERDEVKGAQGKSFSFTFGDYVVKCLLGSVDHQLDNLDEKKLPTSSSSNSGRCTCQIS